ncbi:MAG: hypothetical protein QXW39_07045 [Candidatus Bathyarchaeia archaeon]
MQLQTLSSSVFSDMLHHFHGLDIAYLIRDPGRMVTMVNAIER